MPAKSNQLPTLGMHSCSLLMILLRGGLLLNASAATGEHFAQGSYDLEEKRRDVGEKA